MKKYILFAVVMLFGFVYSTACQSGGGGGVAGKYVNANNADEYLELHTDGTFTLQEFGSEFTGEWQVEGDTITLSFANMPTNVSATGTIEGNTIVDQDGKTWVKE